MAVVSFIVHTRWFITKRGIYMKCLMGCNSPVRAWGLCGSCYNAAKARVDAKEVTREELAEQGLATSGGRGGTPGPWLLAYRDKFLAKKRQGIAESEGDKVPAGS
jgi:hypothetical protein